jgi:hypothetical protein
MSHDRRDFGGRCRLDDAEEDKRVLFFSTDGDHGDNFSGSSGGLVDEYGTSATGQQSRHQAVHSSWNGVY